MGIRDDLKKKGWRQGSFVTSAFISEIVQDESMSTENNDRFALITHSCDILADNKDEQPYVEFLKISPIEGEVGKEFGYTKHPRTFEVTLDIEGHPVWIVRLIERVRILRQALVDKEPAGFIEDEGKLRDLIKAVARQYTRPAFPDSFDARWKSNRKTRRKIEDTIKNFTAIADLYIRFEDKSELNDDQDYRVELTVIMEPDDYIVDSLRSDSEQKLKTLAEWLGKDTKITVKANPVVTPEEITLEDFRYMMLWDFSYLSYREGDRHSQPMEIDY